MLTSPGAADQRGGGETCGGASTQGTTTLLNNVHCVSREHSRAHRQSKLNLSLSPSPDTGPETKEKAKKRKEKGRGNGEGGEQASSVLLLIHSSAFNHSDAVTSSAPGSPYTHKRKAIPFRRRPWVIDLMLNVSFGSAALSAASHGKLMFPTNSVEWYSAFWKWSVGS